MSTGTLYLFCGKMASGKTTLAKQIADQKALTLMSEDVLLGKLYPDEITDVPSYVEFSGKLKSALRPVLVDLLSGGVSIVLDFPANTVKQRKWIKDIVLQSEAHHEFHYLDCTDSVCKAHLKERTLKEPERHATDTVEMFEVITHYFEPPSNNEGFDIILHKTN